MFIVECTNCRKWGIDIGSRGYIYITIDSDTNYKDMDNRMNNNLTPLTETTFFILISLSKKPKHGYSIIKTVEDISEGRIRLATGTLYSAIKRMLDYGLIERVNSSETENEGGRERKYYQLTELGKSLLQAELARLKNLVRMIGEYELGNIV